MSAINVTKASGELEPYDESKLRKSLRSAGAGKQLVDYIARSINEMLVEGISTRKLYREAFRLLRQHSTRTAGRYKLKEAILELGPTGYPFEKFIAELLNRQGYTTETGKIIEGNCVSHEIDVLAQRDDEHYLVECKFHNRQDHKCNVKVPLYIQSRFLDVKQKWSNLSGHKNKKHFGWVVTNTRFTQDAAQYGNCIGLKLLSWDYPKNRGLKDLISRVNLHPITCLSSLDKKQKQQLLGADIVFCMQLVESEKMLDQLDLDDKQKKEAIEEAKAISSFNFNAGE